MQFMRYRTPAILLGPLSLALMTGCPPTPVELSRNDLATAYIDLEETLGSVTLDDATIAATNQRFDRATLWFFVGDIAGAVRDIRTVNVDAQGAGGGGRESVLGGLHAVVTPNVLTRDRGESPTLRIVSLGQLGSLLPATLEVDVRLRAASGEVVATAVAAVGVGLGTVVDQTIALDLQPADLEAGSYLAELAVGELALTVGRLWVVADAPSTVRTENANRIDALGAPAGALSGAVEAVRARNALLVGDLEDAPTAALVEDPAALAAAIADEIAAIEDGDSPYRLRPGELWRVYAIDGEQLPARVYASAAAAAGARVPLILALHGAGGDENLFFRGYGMGKLRGLTERYDALTVTPRTEPLLTDPDLLPGLLAAIEREYNIDDERVFLIGHSLGAAAALQLATAYPGSFAGIVCFGGGQNLGTAAALPKTRVYVGQLDPIAQPAVLQLAALQAALRGLPVTIEVVPDYGHTLAVGAKLPEAVAWLFSDAIR
jgi:predicted esterase